MTKQEFLAMSYPYEIKLVYRNDKSWPIIMAIGNLDEILHTNKDYKPILRPLSDLTKEIEHKGETFIPIVELARMAWKEPLINKFKINNGTLWYNFDGDEYYFEFRPNKGFLFARMTPYESFMPIDNQLGLFQKLIEWHFDIADLISKGEAIDVNTLETNPYK